MRREVVTPPDVYAPTWQFSQAVKVTGGSTVYVSGIMGFRPDGTMPDDIVEQADLVFANLRAVLVAAGGTLDDVVKVTVYVGEDYLAHREELREVRARYFAGAAYPASTLVRVAGFADPRYRIEVEAVAVLAVTPP
ncbi:RidA family protein [Jiangella alba]|uniref:Enamine deaminase RidA, house cleaning of reactive enamine intermediates, YjgF/YER057c/UK114 family n=1 Tax=Jiangella alba TaxID=561176 RepID=A0A1H5PBW4_9ACTN|nr:RidA family protein [Jiangella alba]SEF11210.1 Enamine deaminase RidA, house cleaning of reactive enamine intermediates, YjgF/YER057c/UK114 family [Jiangella alba]